MSKKFLTDIEVGERYGVSRSTVHRMVERGRLPPALAISENVRRWDVADLEAYEAKLKAEQAHV